ncbi:MAG: 4Fe-4S binding protein [Spirochaetes bacterium]|nr:4Fe-4S binding protein [Spirochaetota bacterium]
MASDIYRELSKRLMFENSTLLQQIWQMVANETEAQIIAYLPATAPQIAEKFNLSVEEATTILEELFKRGAAFKKSKPEGAEYRPPKHIVQFHDATLLWKDAPADFKRLWVEFMNTEYPPLLEVVTKAGIPSFMRVIPINATLKPKSEVLVYEDAYKIIEQAKELAVVDCVCRLSHGNCNKPLNVCIQVNNGAAYTLERGTGRAITKEEAFEILKISEEAGLVHMTENKGFGNAICNCCSCCCEMLRFAGNKATHGVVAKSRFTATVDATNCNGCALCMSICPVHAIEVNNTAAIDTQMCIGCGLCATQCPTQAISLHETRPREHIPA